MNKSLVLGLIGLSAAVVLVLFIGRDAATDGGTPQGVSGSAAAPAGPAGSNRIEERGPKSLELGRSSSGGSRDADSTSGSVKEERPEGARAKSRADLDRSRQAHRRSAGPARPRHPGREDGDEAAPGFDVKSQIEEPSSLGGSGESGSGTRPSGAAAANRAVADGWGEVETGDVPAEARPPEEGEVLTLFEGDPITAQTEASVAKDVNLEEDKAEFTADSEYSVPMAGKLTGDAGTISFWVRPNGETADTDNASLVQLRSQHEWNNRLQVWKDGSNVRMVFADGAGTETGASYGSDSWGADEWRLVTVTWGDRMNAMYVNGQLAGTAQYEGGFQILPKTMLHVGSNYSETPSSLNGSVSQFRVYNRALSPDEVGALPSQYPE